MTCTASDLTGEQLPICVQDQNLELPLENYKACCQVKGQESCDRVCPKIQYEGSTLYYALSHQNKTGDDKTGFLGTTKKEIYSCACTQPPSLKNLKSEYKRWVQTREIAATKLLKIDDFDRVFFEDACDDTGYFTDGTIVFTEVKWTTIIAKYNKYATTPLDLEEALALLRTKKKSEISMKMIAIVCASIVGIFIVFIFMKKKMSTSEDELVRHRPRRRSNDSYRRRPEESSNDRDE